MEESSFKLYERLIRLGSDWQVLNITVDDAQDVIRDKFHVVKYLTNAIDLTRRRREEVKVEPLLKKTRFMCL